MRKGRVFWDTNLFIYWIEQAETWLPSVQALVQWQNENNLEPVTSSLTLAELMVRPLSMGNESLADKYRQLIVRTGCLSFGPDESRRFAEIRAKHPRIKPPDCIQLACASFAHVDLFVTNDNRLSRLGVAGIKKITGLADWYRHRKLEN